jgi:nucleotide-binding universal stress UspA family protein
MFNKILVCLDGTDFSEIILPFVVEQAAKFGSKVFLLKVNAGPARAYAFPTFDSTQLNLPVTVEKMLRSQEQLSKNYLNKMATDISKNGIEVECCTNIGPTTKVIIQCIKDNGIDLVAMTSHTYKGWKRLLYGSTVNEVLRESSVPLLVINPATA